MKRIEFIDLAKGVCILLVVMIHTGVNEFVPGIYAAKVPMFFVLSGLFFSKSYDRGGYVLNKLNTIVVPFLLYYLLSYALFYVLNFFIPSVLVGDVTFHGIQDVFLQRNLFNGPLWFLLSLFQVELAFYFIRRYFTNKWMSGLFCFVLGLIGYELSVYDIDLPLWIDTSLVALPFFYIGYLISTTQVLERVFSIWYKIGFVILMYVLYLLFSCDIYMSVNRYTSNYYLDMLIAGTAIVVCLVVLCSILQKQAFLSWIGRNTLVILCTHHIVYRPIKLVLMKYDVNSGITLFLLTMCVECILILFINRFFPLLAGKKKIFI